MKKLILSITGMTCAGCELRIENNLKAINGVIKVRANYADGQVDISYDESKVKRSALKQAISDLDYQVEDKPAAAKTKEKVNVFQLAVIAIILLGVSVILERIGAFDFFSYFPEATEGMGYAAVFVIGLLTSIHCIGMCGGISLSQCVGAGGENNMERIRPSFMYNLGRIASYTVIGGIVGALGSLISFTGVMRGAVALFAGVFMIIMGLNMLDLFPWLRRFSLRLPKSIVGNRKGKSNSPLYIGILNGLMPCGPLQAMQLYALSTGSPVQGAISMFLFALGTSPLLFGFGAISSLLSKKFTAKMMMVSAVLVIVLGLGMLNTGISMSGFLGIGTVASNINDFEPVIEDGYQIVKIEVYRRYYPPITVKKDIPVRFNLHAEADNITGCNNAIIIPKYDIHMPIDPGDNIVEFTPTETGTIPYSCWMNMIKSSITIAD